VCVPIRSNIHSQYIKIKKVSEHFVIKARGEMAKQIADSWGATKKSRILTKSLSIMSFDLLLSFEAFQNIFHHLDASTQP
jgi:hypothetical protein